MTCTCDCCKVGAPFTPLSTENRPGLNALTYRVGTYASFFETMKARLSRTDLHPDGNNNLPLRGLKTRNQSDPAIALLDAWAIVADVLTFYQERIANEGYLRTAVERESIIGLGGLVNYELRPGVAASVYLAYTLEQSSAVNIVPGSRAQNTPGPGELPQSFETGAPVDARGAWNNLAPRLTRPQLLTANSGEIYLAGVNTNLKPNDPTLIVASDPECKRVASVEAQFPQNRTKVVLQDGQAKTVTTDKTVETPFVSAVDLVNPLSKDPAQHPRTSTELSRDPAAIYQPEMDIAPSVLKALNPRIGSQLYAGLRNATVTAPASGQFHALRIQTAPFGHNAPLKPITNAKGVVVGFEEWPLEGGLGIKIGLTRASEAEVEGGGRFTLEGFMAAVTHESPKALIQVTTPQASASKLVPLTKGKNEYKVGHWEVQVDFEPNSLEMRFAFPALHRWYEIKLEHRTPAVELKTDSDDLIEVPLGESTLSQARGRRTFLSAVTGILIDDESAMRPRHPDVMNLDAIYDQILPGSWVVVERPGTHRIITKVREVQKVSVTNYGMSGRVTQLTLEKAWLDPEKDLMLDVGRNTTISAQSEQLALAQEPMPNDVEKDRVELANLYSDLKPGRWLIVEGERTDIKGTSGVQAAELVMLANVEQGVQQIPNPFLKSHRALGEANKPTMLDLPGDTTHSFLHLASPLSYAYRRDSVTIYGNVTSATHGESRKEVLGSGDGSQAFQQFSLHQGPVTELAAANRHGSQSTLSVQVNGIPWAEVETLAKASPTDRVYVTTTDDQDKKTITFGDGKHGMRLPSGAENVIAVYRSGLGSGGNVAPKKINLPASRPLGVKTVVNPVPSTGGADRETADQGRRNIPTAVAALDRLVSISDYGDFARTFAGIGKATAVGISNGKHPVVFVTIAGANAAELDKTSALYFNLLSAYQSLGDSNVPIQVGISEAILLVISASIQLLPDRDWDSVAPQIRTTLLDRFSFDRRALAQDLALSEVVAALQGVVGVQYVEVQILDTISRSDAATPEQLHAKLTEIATVTSPKARIQVPSAWFDSSTSEIHPAGIAFLSPDLPDTLILTEIAV